MDSVRGTTQAKVARFMPRSAPQMLVRCFLSLSLNDPLCVSTSVPLSLPLSLAHTLQEWVLSETISRAVTAAERAVDRLIAQNECRVLVVHDFGKTAITQLKCEQGERERWKESGY
jgi:hypothetical protein